MKKYYVIVEAPKGGLEESEVARFDSFEEATHAFANCVKRADKEAKKESKQRNHPYWHTYSLDEVEVDEDGEAEYTERIGIYRSKIYKKSKVVISRD